MDAKTIWTLLKETFSEWSEDKASRLAAALAYYTVFALAPLLIIVIAVAGLVFGQEAARGELVTQIQGLVGQEGAQLIETMIESASKPTSGIIATTIAIATILFGASGLFGQLQDALNTIWEVPPKPERGILGMVKDRFLSFTMVLGIGFLLLVSLIISAALSALDPYLTDLLPGSIYLIKILNLVISFGLITLLFALIYKILPDVEIAWSDVWIGAAVTSLLFNLGKFVIGVYLGNSSAGSAYGAAGSLVVLLLWVYYSAQILLFGAEFTQVYAKRYGSWAASPQKASSFAAQTKIDPEMIPAPSPSFEKAAALAEKNKAAEKKPSPPGSTYKSFGIVLIGLLLAITMIGLRHSSKVE
ncbi:MAG TPA: YihY/virulence factor BrkB family protein [Anaerolineae bacterium]|nr:YihY/virulence factor BrkB family protein [Anaerolineae bacterium]